MPLPNVTVNVGEESLVSTNKAVPFVPAVIMKTKSGPIGTIETITSESQFISKFGQSDTTTPSAYAIQTYLRTYSYILVTRVANTSEAAFGTGAATFTPDEGAAIDLFEVSTDYKTDLFNAKDVKLVYSASTNKIWLDVSSITGRSTISIKEDMDASTVKAAEYEDTVLTGGLEYILNKLVDSINAMNLGITITNNFTDKLEDDDVPTVEQFTSEFTATILAGNSGNTSAASNEAVNLLVDEYAAISNLDVLVIPEYSNYAVTNYAVSVADENDFIVLVTPSGSTVGDIQTSIANFEPGVKGSLSIYASTVRYDGFNANIPASIAVLHCLAKSDNISKWNAPAGVARGTLSLVVSATPTFPDASMDTLYTGSIPVNCLKYISGKGYVVWGNKTGSGSSSFFDRLNVARLVKYVTKEIESISAGYLFEPITSLTFTNWILDVEFVLDKIKVEYGISDYVVVMDDSINTEATIANNELHGLVKIKPAEVAEYITISFTVTDTITTTVQA